MQETVFKTHHESAGARMVDFAGWYMPVQYEGIVAEHLLVRSACGLFDVSHMGRLLLTGPDHIEFVDRIGTNSRADMKPGQIRYNLVCNDEGTILDDILVYAGLGKEAGESRLGAFRGSATMIVCNAGNHPKIAAWLKQQAREYDVTIDDLSADYAMLALQGPNSQVILQGLTDIDLNKVKYYRHTVGTVMTIADVAVSRTGYTGEDGFELIFPKEHATRFWAGLLQAGEPHDLKPAGLGARDTLRLEAGMPLYGHEIDDTINPLEAGLDWGVRLDKDPPFIGQRALELVKASGVERKLVGLVIDSKRIARQGMEVKHEGRTVGAIMSGTKSPTLGTVIATALIPAALAKPEIALEVEFKADQVASARQVDTTFYKRAK